MTNDDAHEIRLLRRVLGTMLVAGILALLLTTYLGWRFVQRAEALTEEANVAVTLIEDLAGQALPAILNYDALAPFPVTEATRDQVVLSAEPCFLPAVVSAEIVVDRRISFPPSFEHAEITNLGGFDLPVVTVPFDQERLDDNNCARFNDFGVPYPDDLIALLDENPDWSPTLVVRYRVQPTDTTNVVAQRGRTVLVSSEEFVVPIEETAGP